MPFTPSSIAGLQAWYDADALGGADGSAVNTWTDVQGSFNATRAAGTAPKLRYAGLNGKKIVEFTGGDAAQMNISSALMSGATAGMCFIVGKVKGDPPVFGTNTGAFLENFGTAASQAHHPYSDGVIYDDFGLSVRQSYNATRPSLSSSYRIIQFEAGGAAGSAVSRLRMDATVIQSFSSLTVAFSSSAKRIGWNDVPAYLDGYIAEILIYNSVLSQANRELIEGYLAWKWGLTANLPSGHPYKSVAPSSGITATAAMQPAAFVSTATAKNHVKGSVAQQPAAFTTTATAKARLKASAAIQPAAFVSTIAAKARIKATAAMQPAPFGSSGAIDTTPGNISATAHPQIAAFTSTAITKVRTKASAAPKIATFSSTAAAKIRLRGSATAQISPFAGNAISKVRLKGSAAAQIGPFTTTAIGSVAVGSLLPMAFKYVTGQYAWIEASIPEVFNGVRES